MSSEQLKNNMMATEHVLRRLESLVDVLYELSQILKAPSPNNIKIETLADDVFKHVFDIYEYVNSRVSNLDLGTNEVMHDPGYESFGNNDGSVIPMEFVRIINRALFDMRINTNISDNDVFDNAYMGKMLKNTYTRIIEELKKFSLDQLNKKLKKYRLQFAARRAMIAHLLVNTNVVIRKDKQDNFSDCFVRFTSLLHNGTTECQAHSGTLWRGANVLFPEIEQYFKIEAELFTRGTRDLTMLSTISIIYWFQSVLPKYIKQYILKNNPITEKEKEEIFNDEGEDDAGNYSLFYEKSDRTEEFMKYFGILKYSFINQCGMQFNFSGHKQVENLMLCQIDHEEHCRKPLPIFSETEKYLMKKNLDYKLEDYRGRDSIEIIFPLPIDTFKNSFKTENIMFNKTQIENFTKKETEESEDKLIIFIKNLFGEEIVNGMVKITEQEFFSVIKKTTIMKNNNPNTSQLFFKLSEILYLRISFEWAEENLKYVYGNFAFPRKTLIN